MLCAEGAAVARRLGAACHSAELPGRAGSGMGGSGKHTTTTEVATQSGCLFTLHMASSIRQYLHLIPHNDLQEMMYMNTTRCWTTHGPRVANPSRRTHNHRIPRPVHETHTHVTHCALMKRARTTPKQVPRRPGATDALREASPSRARRHRFDSPGHHQKHRSGPCRPGHPASSESSCRTLR